MTSDHSIIQTAEFVIKVLEQGKKTATYKQAVLLAILDIVAAGAAAPIPRGARVAITTREIAERVIEIYWRQTNPFEPVRDGDPDSAAMRSGSISQPLKQSTQTVSYVTTILEHRENLASTLSGRNPSLHRARTDDSYAALVKNIEDRVRSEPLPRLQFVDGALQLALYQLSWKPNVDKLNWTDEICVPLSFPLIDRQGRVAVASEQLKRKSFILLQPYVFEAFVKLNALLRSHVMMHWTRQVTSLNNLDHSGVEQHLFGQSRANLRALVAPLMLLQDRHCFYCERRLNENSHVDHFLPWVRTWDDGVHNLVLAHAECNGSKSDYLAAPVHLKKWRQRNVEGSSGLIDIARVDGFQTVFEPDRAINLARAAYQISGDQALLWTSGTTLVRAETAAIQTALAG